MNEAIRLAIEKGGYKPYSFRTTRELVDFMLNDYEAPSWGDTQIDPLFWQALGKALGWKKKHDFGCYSLQPGGKCDCVPDDLTMWYWHRFIDHLASGRDADSFFKELIK